MGLFSHNARQAPPKSTAVYVRHRPATTPLYQIIQKTLAHLGDNANLMTLLVDSDAFEGSSLHSRKPWQTQALVDPAPFDL